MLDYHLDHDADVTVAAIPVPVAEATRFGILDVDADGAIGSFVEKPKKAARDARPARLGAGLDGQLHLLDRRADRASCKRDQRGRRAATTSAATSSRRWSAQAPRLAYDFAKNDVPGEARARARLLARRRHDRLVLAAPTWIWWRCSRSFNLYNPRWPIRTYTHAAAAGEVRLRRRARQRIGIATDSLVSEGCIISGGRINRSVLVAARAHQQLRARRGDRS